VKIFCRIANVSSKTATQVFSVANTLQPVISLGNFTLIPLRMFAGCPPLGVIFDFRRRSLDQAIKMAVLITKEWGDRKPSPAKSKNRAQSPQSVPHLDYCCKWQAVFNIRSIISLRVGKLAQMEYLVSRMRITTGISCNCRSRHKFSFCGSTIFGLLLGCAPKCPVCWGAYASVCGAGALNLLLYQRWMAPIITLLLVLNLAALFHYARMRKLYGAFFLNLLGALAIGAGIALGIREGMYLGLPLMLLGSFHGAFGVLQSKPDCCSPTNAPPSCKPHNGKPHFISAITADRNYADIRAPNNAD
jgi:hypothetical protein